FCNYWQERFDLSVQDFQLSLLLKLGGDTDSNGWETMTDEVLEEAAGVRPSQATVTAFIFELKKRGLVSGDAEAWLEYHRAALKNEVSNPRQISAHVSQMMEVASRLRSSGLSPLKNEGTAKSFLKNASKKRK